MPFPYSFPPKPGAGLGFETTDYSTIRHCQEVTIHCNRRRNIWSRLSTTPNYMRISYVAATVRPYRQHFLSGVCCADEEKSGSRDRRRYRSTLGTIRVPVPGTIPWVITYDRVTAGNDHLRFAVQYTNQWGSVTTNSIMPIDLPGNLSRIPIKCHDVCISIMITIYNHFVLKKDRIGAITPHAGESTWP